MTAVGLDAAIAQAEQAVARHESQSASDPFHFQLIEHRYVALRDLLNALSAEVRPHGTVTEAAVEAARNALRDAGYVIPMHLVRAALEAAREVHP